MRLSASLALWSLALITPAASLADDYSSPSGWARVETDKGCIVYIAGKLAFYTSKAYRWSAPCVAGQPISGTGRLDMYLGGNVWTHTGTLVAGYFEGSVTQDTFAVENGKWDDRKPFDSPWKYIAKGGCFFFADQYQDPVWEGCRPKGGAGAVRVARRVFAAVNVNANRSTPIPAGGQPAPNTRAGDPVRGQAKFQDGMTAFNAGNYPLAIQYYTEAMALDPANAAKWQVTRGIVYGLNGQLDASIRDYTASINAQPNVATGYYYRSGAYIASGQTALAYRDAQIALRLAPNDAGVQRRAQQLGVPMTGGGGASPGTGTSVADTRSAPGGVSVSGPDHTGENTVKSPVIRDTPPPSSVANTGSAGGRKFSINPKTGAPCVIVTGISTSSRTDGGTAIYLNFANSCNKPLVMIGERIDRKPSPLGPISSTGIGPLEKGRLVCIDYPNGTGCAGWKGGWGN